eukprot:356753-Chlamydomonas_euryale.AAC.7
MHIAAPCVVMGVAYALFPWAVSRSALGGLACLTCGVVGVYTGSGTTTALLRELAVASGASFAVAGPLYNGIGNVGGACEAALRPALALLPLAMVARSVPVHCCFVAGPPLERQLLSWKRTNRSGSRARHVCSDMQPA